MLFLKAGSWAQVGLGSRLGRVPAALAAAGVGLISALGITAQAPAGAQYAGSESCVACHEELAKAFGRNPHQRLETSRLWQGKSCESCHGPGLKHSESGAAGDIKNPAKAGAAEGEAICLRCHGGQPSQANRPRSGHARSQVACTACHTVHRQTEQLVLKSAEVVNRVCASCHAAEWAQFQRPHAHRLPQGAMSCADCHDPHGGGRSRSLRTVAGNEPGCFRCHGDKRGPFPFEHAPLRLEGCGVCHEPHGSANPRMLVRAEVRFLCLECHSNLAARPALGGLPPALHDLRSPRYRNCTVCHSKIHGSFVERGLKR